MQVKHLTQGLGYNFWHVIFHLPLPLLQCSLIIQSCPGTFFALKSSTSPHHLTYRMKSKLLSLAL